MMGLKCYTQRFANRDFRVTYGTFVNNDRREVTTMLLDGEKVLHIHKTLPDIEMLDDPFIRPMLCQKCLNDYEKNGIEYAKSNGKSDIQRKQRRIPRS